MGYAPVHLKNIQEPKQRRPMTRTFTPYAPKCANCAFAPPQTITAFALRKSNRIIFLDFS